MCSWAYYDWTLELMKYEQSLETVKYLDGLRRRVQHKIQTINKVLMALKQRKKKEKL